MIIKLSSKRKDFLFFIISVVLSIVTLFSCLYSYKLYNLVAEQKVQIQELNDENTILKEKADMQEIQWSEEGFNYLAIGNSLTVHGYADYWWDDDRGMASSEDSKDYVNIMTSYLEENFTNVTVNRRNFSTWEVNANDRSEFLELLDPCLSEKLNLVTIQLGENASNIDTWESDFEELIAYVKERAPKAQILIVGDFWSNGERDSQKKIAANNLNVTYVSLEGIKENSEYYAGMGTLVEGKDGEMHAIDHEGVANHPGDTGMQAIAERIIPEIILK